MQGMCAKRISDRFKKSSAIGSYRGNELLNACSEVAGNFSDDCGSCYPPLSAFPSVPSAPKGPAGSCWVYMVTCPHHDGDPFEENFKVGKWIRDTWGENSSNLSPNSTAVTVPFLPLLRSYAVLPSSPTLARPRRRSD